MGCLIEDGGIGERSEAGDEQGALGSGENARVAIVDGTIEEGLGPAPGLGVIAGDHEFNTAEGTDMFLATAGAGEEEVAVAMSGDGRPSVIGERVMADGVELDLVDLRRCLEGGRRVQPDGGGGGCSDA